MKRLTLRLRLALWVLRNPDVLTMLHFEMLRDAEAIRARRKAVAAQYNGRLSAYHDGREDAAVLYAYYLRDMPGAAENRRAL
jgi:hypothetical protein